ncbi:putative enzyme related to lactoylglutathione lyase [Granulicella aggregans]|uniref:Putative enzyme related to lactoylglutathione lyase n=1 Tax=Granulicella aggregans TaxID=474949 RepID=A0A7W7ZJR9_9BACT|nr:putative enzyme related to lactoylglutathione lyase [Granulicella aggregans]
MPTNKIAHVEFPATSSNEMMTFYVSLFQVEVLQRG